MNILVDYLTLATLAFLLPLDIWRFIFHSNIVIKFVRRKLGDKAVLYLPLMYIYWVLFILLIFMNKELLLKGKVSLEGGIAAIIIGFLLLLVGVFLAVWSTATLGLKTAARIPEVLPSSQKVDLVTKGPYRIVRHPIYSGEFLVILGTFLLSGSIAIAIQSILKIFLMHLIIVREEKEMVDRFGRRYEEYRKTIPKLFPAPWKRNFKILIGWASGNFT